MKKIFNLSMIMLLGCSLAFTSCLKQEEDDIFDKDAVDRLEDAKVEYTNILTDQGGKWAMEYFANENEQGYVFVFDFNKDGSVTISGDNKWIAMEKNGGMISHMFDEDTSLWEVIADDGPVLTFNTYNRVLHMFSSPENIPSEGEDATNETGYGHEGDYEFDLMKYTGDTLYLEGKKYKLPIVMYRLPESTSAADYLNQINDMLASTNVTKFPDLVLYGANGKEYIVNNMSTQVLQFYRRGTYKVDTQVEASCLATAHGIRFLNPVWLIDDTLQTKTMWVQNFERQPDGSFLCTDDGVSVIKSVELASVVADSSYTWKLDNANLGGAFDNAYTELTDACNTLKSPYQKKLQFVQFGFDTKNKKCALQIKVGTATLNFFMEHIQELSDTEVKFNISVEGDNNANRYSAQREEFGKLINLFNQTFEVTTENALNPSRLKLTSKANAADYFYIDVQ